ncbi:hypothetical protein GCM10023093_05160 [Nemorincola caseinilytica]|uniref:Uncharacterized protein n=1 Tax=Nemorincola caseinilytica TaxID=2054315 RepID=A0ABP8N850_9BACT
MAQKAIRGVAVVLFLLVNTFYFWQGAASFFMFLFMFLLFVVLSVLLVAQVGKAIIERFGDRRRLLTVAILCIVLGSAVYAPLGLINYDALQGDDMLVAEREGVAGCLTRLRLKTNGKYLKTVGCFGVTRHKGNYTIVHDTIFFDKGATHDKMMHDLAIVRRDTIFGDTLMRLYYADDTDAYEMRITQNKLVPLKQD